MKKELIDRIDAALAGLKEPPREYFCSDGYWRTDPDTGAHYNAREARACAMAYSIGRCEKALKEMRDYITAEVDDEN